MLFVSLVKNFNIFFNCYKDLLKVNFLVDVTNALKCHTCIACNIGNRDANETCQNDFKFCRVIIMKEFFNFQDKN